MRLLKTFVGCTAILRDDDSGKVHCQVSVTAHDRSTNLITVSGCNFDDLTGNLSVIIVNESIVYEYQGIARHSRSGSRVDITLFRGKMKQGRTAQRYDINTPATIVVHTQRGTERPFEATVLNVSVSGVLIQAGVTALDDGDEFSLRLMIGETLTIIGARVVHKKLFEDKEDFAHYGCQLIEIVETKQPLP